jgi:hypothetical protein
MNIQRDLDPIKNSIQHVYYRTNLKLIKVTFHYSPTAYGAALLQVRLDMNQGGFGLTNLGLIPPAGFFVALREFNQWLSNRKFDLLSG